jgi:hypothetical protein
MCRMGDETADVCPGCGEPVRRGEDYVVALEYRVDPEFALHAQRDRSHGLERRFHVAHFRGQLGAHAYELVGRDDQTPQ